MVLPDWDQNRVSKIIGTAERESFCYGSPDQGNLWLEFFEAPFDLSREELNDPLFLYGGDQTFAHEHVFNERLEPLLTYKYAYDLYRSKWFYRFRIQYNKIWKTIAVAPKIQQDVDSFVDTNISDRFVISCHVRHPSHVIEQPSGQIAREKSYFDLIEQTLQNRSISLESDDWRLFLATDQMEVVKTFSDRFGTNVVTFNDVLRSGGESSVDSIEIHSETQIHHQFAANQANWNSQLGVEVVRDCLTLAKADVFLHVVSNVATAVSYMNPATEMIFVDCNN
jgi:hypothetical protein